MGNFFDVLIKSFANIYPLFKNIYSVIGTILSIVVIHKAFYFVIGMFFTRKFKPAKKKHKYGIVIAARNEKYVIGNLLDSINKQDYPKDKLTVFVVADNCTDDTAEIARSKGAICYERHDQEHKTKGFALEFLFDKILESRDYFTTMFFLYHLSHKDEESNSHDESFCEAFNSWFEKNIANQHNKKLK